MRSYNLNAGSLSGLTALAELQSECGILERHLLLLKAHVIEGQLVGASSLEGFHVSLQLRRIGGISGEELATDVDGKVAEILNNSDRVEVVGGSATPSGSTVKTQGLCWTKTTCFRRVVPDGFRLQEASRPAGS